MSLGAVAQQEPISKQWRTPSWLFEQLHAEFDFQVDAAATQENTKLPHFWTLRRSGLERSWNGLRVWCNPPFGAGIGSWLAKAREHPCLAVFVVPARTETRWWYEHVLEASEIRFVRGRVHFDPPIGLEVGPKGSRPQWGSVVVIFDGRGGPVIGPTITTPRLLRSRP